jgi:hypothetical protein
MRSNPQPDTDGVHFNTFPPSLTNKNGKRSVKTTASGVPRRCVFGTKVRLDITEIGRKQRGGQSTWTPVTAAAAAQVCLELFTVIYICIPIFHLRAIFLSFPGTQVKNNDGAVIGARDMCDQCFSNDYVTYDGLRVVKPVHGFECKAAAIDVKCRCTNPECPGFQEVLRKHAERNNMTLRSVSQRLYIKQNKLHYSFSNMSPILLKKYPPSIRCEYQLYNRTLGMITLRLRRSLFEQASEADTHQHLSRRYHDHWSNNNLHSYMTILRECPESERVFFEVPPKRAPKALLPMSLKLMGNLNDYFWVEEDRARIVRMIQANVPEKVFTIDCTFEVARLADDNTNAAVVVCNEKQLVCFFAFVDKESSEAYKLLLALIKARYSRRGMDVPNLVFIDDRCCNDGDVLKSVFVDAGLTERCPHKDFLHAMLLGTKTMRPANMTGIAAARALLVQITQDLFFHPGRSDSEMVTLYQIYILVHDDALVSEVKEEQRVADTIRIMRFVMKSKHHSNKNITTPRAAIVKIRSSKTYNKNFRKHKRTKEDQYKRTKDWIEEIEAGTTTRVKVTTKAMRPSNDHSTGYTDFLKRQLPHFRKGCHASRLNFEDQYILIPPTTLGGLPQYAVVETQAPTEAKNRTFGDISRGTSSMRNTALERRAGIQLLIDQTNRRIKLGYDNDKHYLDLLFEDRNEEIEELFAGRAGAWQRENVLFPDEELEPMFFDYQGERAKDKYVQMVEKMLEEKEKNTTSSSFPSSSSGSAGRRVSVSPTEETDLSVPSSTSSIFATSSSIKSASSSFTKYRNKNLTLDNPLHTPSRPKTLEDVTGKYPSSQWTNDQTAFVVASLVNLRSTNGTAASKRLQVQFEWCQRAMDPNNEFFSMDKIPMVEEIRLFSEAQGQNYEQLSVSASVQHDTKVKQETKPRPYVLFHSNDEKSSDINYLLFPLKDADKREGTTGITNRRMMAYSTALNVTGRSAKRREKLQDLIVSAKGEGIERPGDIDWSTWSYQSYN